ncbi:MAG: 30S ribosomal protein S6 [candidate division KSB1 bacterium]|nr:30S ribosomal protein S6 [candidate division KSB1 bacterium]MDZ7345413.1 30S ribosomal protein S6 [candidate division KSB1 bacterium]
MRKYETIFILDSLLKNEEIDAIVNKYERFISANGGQINVTEKWGKKRLAYEIKKRQYGYYVLIRFDGPPTIVKALERELRLNEAVLRYKTLLMNKKAIEALAARGIATTPQPAAEPELSVAAVTAAESEKASETAEQSAKAEEEPAAEPFENEAEEKQD